MEAIAQTSFGSYLKREIEIMERLLDDPKLASLRASMPQHPAVSRHDIIARYLEGTLPFKYPNEGDLVLTIGSAILDAMALDSAESAEAILKTVTDPEVIRQLRQRASDPEQFVDQLTAFRCWNLLRGTGYEPRLVEQEGMPDIAVSVAGAEEWIECKRLRLGTGVSRVRKVIQAANTQIKRADPGGAGAVYIFVERPQHRIVFDDSVPAEVEVVAKEVERELGSGASRSVGAVIVGWDDYLLLGDFPSPTSYFCRRSFVRTHRSPRRALALSPSKLELGRTIYFRLRWEGQSGSQMPLEKFRIGDFTITQLFRQECELPGYVRAVHAAAALETPDKFVSFRAGKIDVILATKRITLGAPPYTLIVLAAMLNGLKQILLGFRFYRDDKEPDPQESAYGIFLSFLERYGLPVTVGSQTGLLIPTAVMTLPADGRIEVAHTNQSDDALLSSFFRIRDGVPRIADVAWAFAISKARYNSDFTKHRR